MPGSNSRPNVSEGYMVTSKLPGRPATGVVDNVAIHYACGFES